MTPPRSGSLALCGLLLAPLAACSGGRATAERPNILVLDIDSLRADRVLEQPPPTIAGLRSRGTTLTAVASSGWTLPAFGALLSGRHPPAELLLPAAPGAPEPRTFPLILSAYGYHGYVAWGGTLLSGHPRRLEWVGGGEGVDLGDLEGVIEALRGGRLEEPFVTIVHDMDLHMELENLSAEGPLDAARYDPILDAYDRRLARLVAALGERGLDGRTLVVLTSDHGEELGEHGQLGHGSNLWEEVLRVPLIVVDPALPGGRRVEQPVAQVDIAPTLLARAGVPVHAEMTGASLLPTLGGADPGPLEVYSETNLRSAALHSGPWKLALQPAGCLSRAQRRHPPLERSQCPPQLFNLDADPGEQVNLAASEAERAAAMEAALLGWVQQQTPADLNQLTDFRRTLQERGYW